MKGSRHFKVDVANLQSTHPSGPVSYVLVLLVILSMHPRSSTELMPKLVSGKTEQASDENAATASGSFSNI